MWKALRKEAGFRVDLQFDSNLPRLPQEVETTIFRIVQASLTNIHRHSGSKKLLCESITIRKIREWKFGMKGEAFLSLTLLRICQRAGVGIQGMQERVRQLQGKFEIKSGQCGTTVIVVLPNRGISGSSKSGKPTSQ